MFRLCCILYKHLKELCLLELEAALLKELDPQLYAHLVTDSMESFTFCHRYRTSTSVYIFGTILYFNSLHMHMVVCVLITCCSSF